MTDNKSRWQKRRKQLTGTFVKRDEYFRNYNTNIFKPFPY